MGVDYFGRVRGVKQDPTKKSVVDVVRSGRG